jgi:hypothetical protein
MRTREIIRTLVPGLFVAGGLLLTGALSATVSAQDVDSRWLPWLGCWEATEGTGEAPLVCIRPLPEGQGVEITTWSEGALVSTEAIQTDGVLREVEREGCRGTERARFSEDGRRVYMESDYVCEGGAGRAASGLLAMVNPMEWVDIKVVEVSGQRVPWALRYRMARAAREAEVGMGDVVASRAMAVRGARIAASAPLTEDDLLEVVGEAGPEAAQALLVERGDRFDVDAELLVRLADAGVPGNVIDVVVALSYPDRFMLNAGAVEEMEQERTYAGHPMAYAGSYRWSFWNPYFYDPFYSGYGYGMYGYSPFGFNYGYYGRYYRPTTIIVQPRPPAEVAPPANRVVRPRGYTGGASSRSPSTGSVSSGGSGSVPRERAELRPPAAGDPLGPPHA